MAATRRPSSRLPWNASSSPTSTVRRSAARPTHGPASARFAALRTDDLIGCDAFSAAASASPDTPAAFLIASMILRPSPSLHASCLMHRLHSCLHRLVGDSHLGKEMNKLFALIDGWMLEAALLALRAACGAAAGPGRRVVWSGEHTHARSCMRACVVDRLCICPSGVAMSSVSRVPNSTHGKVPPMSNP